MADVLELKVDQLFRSMAGVKTAEEEAVALTKLLITECKEPMNGEGPAEESNENAGAEQVEMTLDLLNRRVGSILFAILAIIST